MLRFILLTVLLVFSTLLTEFSCADSGLLGRRDVQEFIQYMVKKHGFSQQQMRMLFSQVKLRPQVILKVSKPLEKEPWHFYQKLFVSEWRIEHGVEFWKKHAATLKKAQEVYGVPPGIIVATLGVETKYGQRVGDFRVLDSLTNLAFSRSKRAPFFKRELEEFILLTREQHLDPLKVMGSYAGAIGVPQFMPSSYRHYAIDFSKNGTADLLHNDVDVIGSVANYYHKHGWKPNGIVAMRANIIPNKYYYLPRKDQIPQPINAENLAKYGITPQGKIIPKDASVKVIELESTKQKEYWLGFHNFNVIRRYNASDLYAMAVYQLSQKITERKGHS